MIRESTSALDFATWLGLGRAHQPTAVALLIHGLNCKPGRMTAIAEVLVAQGVECLNVSLRGHGDGAVPELDPDAADRNRLEAFKRVTRAIWLSEVRAAYDLARRRADDRGVPLILVGFSLGAAVGSDLASGPGSEVSFAGMILFAPAFSVHWYTQLLRCLAPFPSLTLKSFSPKDYAANRGTPIAAYNALFESIAALRKRRARPLVADALIFIDPRDELVSYRGLRAICAAPGAERWQMVPIPKTLRNGQRDYHHLIIDEESLGSPLWNEVVRHVKQFLADLREKHAASASDTSA